MKRVALFQVSRFRPATNSLMEAHNLRKRYAPKPRDETHKNHKKRYRRLAPH